MVGFEWDTSKAASNKKKHGVTFDEAKSVFYDDFAIQFFENDNFETEDRFLILGHSNRSRILLICHCERDAGDLIRIISARTATAKERKLYAGGGA